MHFLQERPKDFITAVDEKNIIVVKEVKENETYEDLEQDCRSRSMRCSAIQSHDRR